MTPGGGDPSPYPESMVQPEEHRDVRDDETDDLLSAIEVIEAQPLATRAEAYDGLHDTLSRRLEVAPGGEPATP